MQVHLHPEVLEHRHPRSGGDATSGTTEEVWVEVADLGVRVDVDGGGIHYDDNTQLSGAIVGNALASLFTRAVDMANLTVAELVQGMAAAGPYKATDASGNALATATTQAAIKAKTGHTLLTADLSSGGPFSMMLQQQGQGLFDENGDIAVSTPAAVQTLTLLQTMQQKGLIKNAKGWDASVTSAKDGDSAVTPEAVWWIGTLEGEAPELSGKYAVRDLPVFADGGAPTSNNGGSGMAIPAQAKNPQLAADFMAFVLANTDNQASMMKDEGLFPAYLPALKSDYFQQPSDYFSGQKVFQTFAELTPKIPSITFTSDQSVAADAVSNAVAAAVLNGEDPKKALDDAAKQIANSTGRKIAG